MLVLKDVLRPRLKPISSGGERVPTRQVPYRQQQVLSKSSMYIWCNSIRQCLAIFLSFNISSHKLVCSIKLIEVGVAYYSGYFEFKFCKEEFVMVNTGF